MPGPILYTNAPSANPTSKAPSSGPSSSPISPSAQSSTSSATPRAESSVQQELSRHHELKSGRAGLTLAITTALANHINLQKSCLGRVSDSIMGMYKKAINQLVNGFMIKS